MLGDFEKEKVFWTRKMNLNLVKFIEKKPNIWNPKHPKYTSVEAKDNTFAAFAAKYGNEFSGQAVKERWTNIRTTFAKYLRKVKASAGQNEVYKVTWNLWEPCQFLIKVYKHSKQDFNLHTDVKMSLTNSDSQPSEHEDNILLDDDNGSPSISCKAVAENLLTVFKGIQNDALGLDNARNSKIGKTVTEKLSQLDSLKAAKISIKIMDILWLHDQNNPFNPNNVKLE